MSIKLEETALVCTEMLNGVCLMYRFVPVKEAEQMVNEIMTR
jgi:hypothetical protein